MFFEVSKPTERDKILDIGVSKTGDNIKNTIKIPNLSQEPPVSSKAKNQDLNEKDVLRTFKIKMESQI